MLLTFQKLTTITRSVRILVWFICLALIVALGTLRIATQAQFAFASLMLFPVIVGCWLSGRSGGWLLAVIASLLWGYADYSKGTTADDTIISFLNALVHLINYGIVVELVGRVMVLLQRESSTARTDRLTGLLNRRGFMEMAAQQVSAAERIASSVVIAFIDLDRFKQLNDTKGHEAGDAALREIGATLQKTKRASDICGRIGGDVVYSRLTPHPPNRKSGPIDCTSTSLKRLISTSQSGSVLVWHFSNAWTGTWKRCCVWQTRRCMR